MLKNLVATSKFLFKTSNLKKIAFYDYYLRSNNRHWYSKAAQKTGPNLDKEDDINKMSQGIIKYLNQKDKNNFQFNEICNMLKDSLTQISECNELVEETKNLIKESTKEESSILKKDMEFYKEEKENLITCNIFYYNIKVFN